MADSLETINKLIKVLDDTANIVEREVLQSVLPDLEEIINRSVMEQFDSEGSRGSSSWDPLKGSTVRQRLRLDFGGEHPILVRNGDLRTFLLNSVKGNITASGVRVRFTIDGNDEELRLIANYQHFGTPNARYPIPARPILAITQGDRDQIKEILKRQTIKSIRELFGRVA